MLHRFDLHVHSFFSKDAASSPESLIAAARKQGLSGIVITDHNTCEAHDYALERGLSRPDGKPVDGFLLVPGVEVSTAEGHLLCIGTILPQMQGEPAAKVWQEILARGGVPIPAHPYDLWRAGIREDVLDTLDIQVLEIFNAAVSMKKYNAKAEEYALRRNLRTTAASDAHHASAVGASAMAYDLEELSVAALLKAITAGGELQPRYLSFQEGVKKHFGNWFRIFNPRPQIRAK